MAAGAALGAADDAAAAGADAWTAGADVWAAGADVEVLDADVEDDDPQAAAARLRPIAPTAVKIFRVVSCVIAFSLVRSPALDHVVTVGAVHAAERFYCPRPSHYGGPARHENVPGPTRWFYGPARERQELRIPPRLTR